MVEVTRSEDKIIFDVQGLHKLWSFKSRIEIPTAHIRGVRIDAKVASAWWAGLRAPGTSIPGILRAGTFYNHGRRIFWDVHDVAKTVIVELADERYDEIIVEVSDPAATVALIASALKATS